MDQLNRRGEAERHRGAVTLRGGAIPTRHSLLLEYDADNSFGASIRDVAICEYDAMNAEALNLSSRDVILNGKDHHEWLLDNLAR